MSSRLVVCYFCWLAPRNLLRASSRVSSRFCPRGSKAGCAWASALQAHPDSHAREVTTCWQRALLASWACRE